MKELVKYVKEVNRNIGYKIYQARLERDVSREELAKYYTSSCRLAEFKLITWPCYSFCYNYHLESADNSVGDLEVAFGGATLEEQEC